MRAFTKEELGLYNGSNGISYIAYRGKVYDVSKSYHWKKGRHHAMHLAGNDLTVELEKAPHGMELVDKYPVLGELR